MDPAVIALAGSYSLAAPSLIRLAPTKSLVQVQGDPLKSRGVIEGTRDLNSLCLPKPPDLPPPPRHRIY